jgi:hypothetical protein
MTLLFQDATNGDTFALDTDERGIPVPVDGSDHAWNNDQRVWLTEEQTNALMTDDDDHAIWVKVDSQTQEG